MLRPIPPGAVVVAALVVVASARGDVSGLPPAAPGPVDFVTQVKPVLEAHCVGCHGADKRKGDYRLDRKELAFGEGGSGINLAPKEIAQSPLLLNAARVTDTPMPPDGKGMPVTAQGIGVLRAWIEQGAPWPQGVVLTAPAVQEAAHWSFVPPTRPVPPVVSPGWVGKPIDAFVLASLADKGLRASPQADRVTLIRRLSLDLLGLPPAPTDVDAFVADRRFDAYERLVERLLASPHYGERWGRHWLDAARYADTNGFEKDAARSIWPYRDWVIDAFNRDLPFDRFATEQLAGDLLPGATTAEKVATGFLRNSMLNEEGGVDPEQFRIEGILDRVDAVGKAFLGLTINCAQCHTHKYDPIQHREYYQFFAFLNGDSEDELEVLTAAQETQRATIRAAVARLADEALADPAVAARMAAWQRAAATKAGRWIVLEDAEIHAAFGAKFEALEDGSFIARGDRYKLGTYVVTAPTKLRGMTGFRLELLPDDTLPRGGPGRDKDGVAVLTELSVEAAPVGRPTAASKVALVRATADLASAQAGKAIDGDNQTGWSTDAGAGRRNQARHLVVQAAAPVGHEGGTRLVFTIVQRQGEQRTIGRFRLSVTTSPAPEADPRGRAAHTSDPRALFEAYRLADPALAQVNERIDALYRDWPQCPTTLVVSARATPRKTFVFRRGDWRKPLAQVQPGTPAALHPMPQGAPPNRLGLARWITDPRNPLTARVIANRVWHAYFGQGLIATPEDFGTRAEPASHPALLDWLAVELRESGWSLKHLHRLIVTSATYRQSSRATPAALTADPYNRWLARGARLRVEAEIIRDVMLTASGLLSRKIGGPSVFPAIPAGVLDLAYGAGTKWDLSTGDDRHRRAMYTFWKRTVPYPSAAVFDAPSGDFACVRRTRSNTPLQALTTLNDPVFHEAAQALALRIWREGGRDDRSRVHHAFRLAVGRRPSATELREVLALLARQRRHFRGNTARAVLVSAPDPKSPPPGLDLHQIAPWTMVARVILNLDETITRE